MKIVVLEGSPNKNGSSNMLAGEFMRGAQEAGHSVQVIDAAHANIHPCTGSYIADMKGRVCRRMMWKSSGKKFLQRI